MRTVKTGVEALAKENQRLQREFTRNQALARAAHRAVGLAPPAPTSKTKAGKKPRKRRVARALISQRLCRFMKADVFGDRHLNPAHTALADRRASQHKFLDEPHSTIG